MREAAIDRRTFLRAGAAGAVGLAAGVALADCGGAPKGHAERHVTTPATPTQWRQLGEAMQGRLIVPGDPAYATARLLYDPKFDWQRPLAVARCASSNDVARVLGFARDHGYPVAVRCGGHSYGGWSGGTGRLVLDVTPMSAVVPAPAPGGVARVGAGVRLIDLYEGLGSAGQLVPGGSCPTVGIAGLALGGGVGVFTRRYGLTCDQLEAVDVVTADGVLHHCTAADDEDLFWACRGGGGGNFGVATSFWFRTHPLPPLTLFTYDFDFDAAHDVLGRWQEWLVGLDDAVWSNCQLLAGAGERTLRVNGVACAGSGVTAALLAPLLASLPTPATGFLGGDDYVHSMMVEGGCSALSVAACHLQGTTPAGVLSREAFTASSNYVAAPMDDARLTAAVEVVASFASEFPELGGGCVFDALGGAANAPDPTATAFVHRRFLASIQSSFSFGAGATPAMLRGGAAWLREVRDTVYTPSTGAYQNYADPTLADWATAYYGENLARLERIKRRVDPDGVFRFPQSVPLS